MGSDIYQVNALTILWIEKTKNFFNKLRVSFKQSVAEQSIGVGEGSFIKKAIIDKNVKIGKNVKVMKVQSLNMVCSNKVDLVTTK